MSYSGAGQECADLPRGWQILPRDQSASGEADSYTPNPKIKTQSRKTLRPGNSASRSGQSAHNGVQKDEALSHQAIWPFLMSTRPAREASLLWGLCQGTSVDSWECLGCSASCGRKDFQGFREQLDQVWKSLIAGINPSSIAAVETT